MSNKYDWFARRRNFDQEKKISIRIPSSSQHPLKQNSASSTTTTTISSTIRPISQSSRSSSNSSLNSTQLPSKSTSIHQNLTEIKEISTSTAASAISNFVDPLGVTLAAENADSSLLSGVQGLINLNNNNNYADSKNDPLSKSIGGNSRNFMASSLASLENGYQNGGGRNDGADDDDDTIDGSSTTTTMLQNFESWSTKRAQILQKYTTNEKLSIVTSFLPGGIPLQTQVTVTDKLKHRLEQLDVSDSSERKHSDLNQKEYIEKINELNRELMKAWRDDQRVQAIKIAIQCAKILSNTTAAPHFYPSQFVLITDVLDTFGRLVYDRLYSKASAESGGRLSSTNQKSSRFTHRSVPESTKETCRNWFYKIASIREVLPRFYVETCILMSMRYLTDLDEQRRCLVRLASMIRGLSDPLVAAYARAYLCRVGMNVDPTFKEHIWRCFHDTMTTYERSLSKAKHADLYTPAFEWILRCLTHESTQFDLGPIVEYCRQKKSPVLLVACIKSTPSKLLVEGVESPMEWIRLIRECRSQKSSTTTTNNPNDEYEKEIVGEMIRSLGKSVIAHEPPNPDDKLRLLNEAWKLFMRDPSLDFYIQCAEIWFEFAAKHFGPREINTLLEDVVQKCATAEKSTTDHHRRGGTTTTIMEEHSISSSLFRILEKILQYLLPKHGSRALFDRTPQFVNFLDLLRTDDVRRREACEKILSSLCEYLPVGGVDDSELANHVLQLCRTLHDVGLNEASTAYLDEKRHVGRLIRLTLDRFDFCPMADEYFSMDNAQKQLDFLVDCRGYFSNLDDVQTYVVHRFNALSQRMSALRSRTRKTAAFVRACVANSYITIPSIGGDHFVRLKLYLESATIALFNNCLVQADSLLKACISLIPDVPTAEKVSEFKQKSTESRLLDFIQELMSLLLLVPDSPDERQQSGGIYLYLFEGLMNATRRYPWMDNSDGKFTVFLNALRFLSTSVQAEYPYRIESIESNDTLYGGDERYIAAVRSSSNSIVQEMLDYLKKFDTNNAGQKRRLIHLSLDFVECILEYGDIERDSVRMLAWNLWNLAKKNAQGMTTVDQERQAKVGCVLAIVRSKSKFEEEMGRDGGHWAILAEKFYPF